MNAKIVFVLLILGASIVSCNRNESSYGSSSNFSDPVDYERSEVEIREDLGTREARNPKAYLEFNGNYRENLIGETVITGEISNTASIAKFKDPVLHITGYSKTQTKIGTWEHVVYEVFAPGSSKRIKVKLYLPSSVSTVDVEIYNAVALRKIN